MKRTEAGALAVAGYRRPDRHIMPQPKCNKFLRLAGLTVHCDAPEDHLPPDEHVGTVRWYGEGLEPAR